MKYITCLTTFLVQKFGINNFDEYYFNLQRLCFKNVCEFATLFTAKVFGE